jgi:hypothetical protein
MTVCGIYMRAGVRWQAGSPLCLPLERAVPVPCCVPRVWPRHGLLSPGQAVLGPDQKKPGLGPGQRARAAWPFIWNMIFCDVRFPTLLSLLAVAESARGRGLSFAAASQVINACGSVPRAPFAPVARLQLQAFALATAPRREDARALTWASFR